MSSSKHIALISIFIVAFLFAVSVYFASEPWSPWLKAFAEAGLIGGLADWFAVVALFKKPLGLPIPHTGVLAKERNRIGRALGLFVAENLLTGEMVRNFIKAKDPIGVLDLHLTDPKLRKSFISKWLPGTVSSSSIEEYLHDVILKEDRLVWGLAHLKDWLSDHRDIFKGSVNLPWYVPSFVGSLLSEKLYERIKETLEASIREPEHPLRVELERIAKEGITKLAYEQKFTESLFDKFCLHLAEALRTHRLRAEEFIDHISSRVINSVADELPLLAEGVFNRWPEKEFTEKLESMVRSDLDWIRVNGALVGGMIGLVLHAILNYFSIPMQ